jgi:hypothetical protein
LVYRLIFVMAAEDREILHADGAGDVRATRANGYAKGRLRERSRNRIACAFTVGSLQIRAATSDHVDLTSPNEMRCNTQSPL